LTCPEDLNEIRNPVSYIGRHAYWRFRDQCRQDWRAVPLDGAPEPAVEPFIPGIDSDHAPLNHALDQLREKDRELIKRHYFEEASYTELAESLGQKRDNLHTRVRRILRRMRETLEKPAPSPTGRDDGKRQASIHRKAVQSDVGKRSRQKSSTMSA
jgi:DNA-directed RNA polymerase specialized sigma24 family protein